MSDVDSYVEVLADIEAANGRIDILINCAGIGEPLRDEVRRGEIDPET